MRAAGAAANNVGMSGFCDQVRPAAIQLLAPIPPGRPGPSACPQREGVCVNGARIPPNKPTHLPAGTALRFGRLPQQFTVVMQGSSSSGAPSQVRASHLLVKHAGSRRPSSWKEPTVTRSQEEAAAMVQQFRDQLAASPDLPAAFAALATRESHCGSARSGGDLDWFGCVGPGVWAGAGVGASFQQARSEPCCVLAACLLLLLVLCSTVQRS